MPVIAVINRKGGSGKSTLATHLAAYLALTGNKVMLGDVDRQQSAQTWLKLRGTQKLPPHAAIQGWTLDPKNVLRAPAGVTHMVLDTPGGMRGFDLARIVMSADAVLMPVCNSVFDRDSAAECFAELKTLPRVASGRCKVAAIGMRLDARTKSAEVIAAWAAKLDLPFLGVLRETQVYVKCVELGLTIFDLPRNNVQADIGQWKPIMSWLEEALRQPEPAAAKAAEPAAAEPKPAPHAQAAEPRPAAPARAPAAPAPRPAAPAHATQAARPNVPARPLPAQILANPPPRTVPAVLSTPVTAAPRVERVPLGEQTQTGTLASIGELARTLKASEQQASTSPPPPRQTAPSPHAQFPRGTTTPPPSKTNDMSGAPLRPSRPIVPSGARAQGGRDGVPSPAGTAKPATQTSATAARTEAAKPGKPALTSRLGQLLDTLPLPRFLQRNS